MILALSDAVWVLLLSPISIAVVGLLTAITVKLSSIKTTGESTKETGEITHSLVNSQKSDMEKYQEMLVKTMEHAGVAVPKNPNPHD